MAGGLDPPVNPAWLTENNNNNIMIITISACVSINVSVMFYHVHVADVVNGQENLRRFSWYKDSMNRKEAEKKVLDYRQVQFIVNL